MPNPICIMSTADFTRYAGALANSVAPLNPIPVTHWVIQQCFCSTVYTLCKGTPAERVQLYWDTRRCLALRFATQEQANQCAELLDLGSYEVAQL